PPSTTVPRQLIGLLVSRSVLRISICAPMSLSRPPAWALAPLFPLWVELISSTESSLWPAPPTRLALLPLSVQFVHVREDCTSMAPPWSPAVFLAMVALVSVLVSPD